MTKRIQWSAIFVAVFLAGILLIGAVRQASSQAPNPPAAGGLAGVPPHGLGKHLWVIITTDVPGNPADLDLTKRHLAHQVDLEKRGIMFGAGPVSDPSGKHEYGMIIIRANSAAEAKQIADSDPMHQTGHRTYTLHEWTLNEGRFNVSVNFSSGTYTFE